MNDDIQNSYTLKANHMPPKLYKYRKFDDKGYSKDCLENNKVWCTTLDNYNDPYEGYIKTDHFSIYRNKMLKIAKEKGSPQRQIPNITNAQDENSLAAALFPDNIEDQKKFINEKYPQDKIITENATKNQIKNIQTNTKICSFSEIKPFNEDTDYNKANRLMWAHYGDDHKGFCLEYSTQDKSKGFFPVLYSSKLLDISPYLIRIQNKEDLTSLLSFYTAMRKEDVWEYEKEWRYILLNDATKNNDNLQNLKPTAIYLGARISPDNKNYLIKQAQSLHIDIHQIEMDTKEYKLNEKAIL